MVALGLGLAATPALAAPKGGGGGCAAATDSFNANMKEARFWIDAADRLADAGNGEMADKASAEADHFLNQAEGALGAWAPPAERRDDDAGPGPRDRPGFRAVRDVTRPCGRRSVPG